MSGNTLSKGGLLVENLSCTRGGVPVLQDVCFRLNAGNAMLLRGPNGIGKTTLLRTVAGLQPPARGRVRAGGSVAWAGHADAIKPTLTVTENLEFWASVYGGADSSIAHKQVQDALSAFNLGTLSDRYAGSLSAGQKRRLGLARLCVTGADIWALDEPTVSLDADSVALFAEVVRNHCAEGGATLIATHIDPGFEAETLDLEQYRARLTSGSGENDTTSDTDQFAGEESL